jgi:MFS family permease
VRLRRLLALASAIVFIDAMFFAAIVPLLPTFAEEYDLSKTGAGILAAAYPAGTLLGSLPGGWIAARLGVRATVFLGLGLLIGSSLVFAFADSIVVLDVARFVQGLGSAASWAGALGWLVGAAPRERRGEMIGSAMAAAIVGALLGPVLGAAAAGLGTEVVFTAVGVAAGGLLVWAALTPSTQVPPRTPIRTVFAGFKDPRIATGMWIVILVGLMFGTLDVLAPLRFDELGAGAVVIGATFVAAGALEATMSPFFGRISDRHGRILPCLVGLGASGVAMLLLPWPEAILVLSLIVLVTGPSVGILWTPSMAMLSDGADDFGIDQGYAVALINLAWSTGQTVGSAGGARLGEAYGDALPYLTLAVACGLTFGALARPRAAAVLAES